MILLISINGYYNMNKKELIDSIANDTGFSKTLISKIIQKTLDAIVREVSSREKVTLVGFGTFDARYHSSKKGRNPATGEPIDISGRIVPHFSAGKAFKQSVANDYLSNL